jgi:hypothetical protein
MTPRHPRCARHGLGRPVRQPARRGLPVRQRPSRAPHTSEDVPAIRQHQRHAQLYRLTKVEAAVAANTPVYVVEGEKDVHALESLGAVATTNPMGATNWSKVDASPLHGGKIIVVPDIDQAGRRWVREVLASLDGMCQSVEVRAPRVGNDPADHVAGGRSHSDLVPIEILPEPDDNADDEFERRNRFELRVNTKLDELRILDEARDRLAAEKAAALTPTPFDAGLLEEILARPAEPPSRVTGLIPSDAGTLIVAQRKTGTTTWMLNLAHSLITGKPFLGRFTVRPIAGGSPSSTTKSPRPPYTAAPRRRPSCTCRPAPRPRGRSPAGRPVRPRLHRPVTNDPGEVGAWLADLDRYARGDLGVTDLVMSVHAGWDGERSRGSTALEDWADSIVNLTKDDDGVRYMRAIGRDVEVDEDALSYDGGSRLLAMSGAGSGKQAAIDKAIRDAMVKGPRLHRGKSRMLRLGHPRRRGSGCRSCHRSPEATHPGWKSRRGRGGADMRPDVVVVTGRAAIVVSGDRAHDLLTACGVAMAPTFAGWQHHSLTCHDSALTPRHAAGRCSSTPPGVGFGRGMRRLWAGVATGAPKNERAMSP